MDKLSTLSNSRDNNFNLIRAGAALGVFVSHCFPFTGHEFGGKPQLPGYLSLNVFEDLGRPDAGAHLLKAALVTRIDEIIRQRGLKQVEAARLLGLSQPDVSRLLRGSFCEYSMERLLSFRSRQARFQAEWPNGSQPGDKPGLHRLRVTSCRTSCPRSVGTFLTALRSCRTSCSRSDGTFLTVLRSCGTSCLRSDGTFLTALRSCGTSCPRSDGTFLTSLRSCGM